MGDCMDEYTVIECSTQIKAESTQALIHDARVVQMSAMGYTIINNEIVPKNALTGLDDLTACRTTKWDTPVYTGKATFYIEQKPASISISMTGVNGKDYQVVTKDPLWPITSRIATSDRFSTGFE